VLQAKGNTLQQVEEFAYLEKYSQVAKNITRLIQSLVRQMSVA